MKYTLLLYHLIIKLIYHEIWLPSRQIIYSLIFSTSNLLPITIRTQTTPIPQDFILNKIAQYIKDR